MSSFRLLVHKTFQERVLEFIAAHSDHSDALQTQLRKSVSSPTTGSQIREIPEHLSGKLYKLYVSGGTGFRYIYYYDAEHEVVIPVFLSMKPKVRKSAAWDVAEVVELAGKIVDDFANDRMEKFSRMQLA